MKPSRSLTVGEINYLLNCLADMDIVCYDDEAERRLVTRHNETVQKLQYMLARAKQT